MRYILSLLTLLALPAHAQDARVWSGVVTDARGISIYKVTLSPEETYLIAQAPGMETCYVDLSVAVDTNDQVVLIGLPMGRSRPSEAPDTKPCERVGWVKGQQLSLLIDPVAGKMAVVVDGAEFHVLDVTAQ